MVRRRVVRVGECVWRSPSEACRAYMLTRHGLPYEAGGAGGDGGWRVVRGTRAPLLRLKKLAKEKDPMTVVCVTRGLIPVGVKSM